MKYPLNNKALNGGGMPDFGNVELSEFESTLMRLKMRDSMMSEEERRTPDTFGCDGMFLEYFVTPEMEDDFSLIARDFPPATLPSSIEDTLLCETRFSSSAFTIDTDPVRSAFFCVP